VTIPQQKPTNNKINDSCSSIINADSTDKITKINPKINPPSAVVDVKPFSFIVLIAFLMCIKSTTCHIKLKMGINKRKAVFPLNGFTLASSSSKSNL
jgi:hypothetical protein